MLKMTSVKLEKISNTDMYLFIKKRIRGGISKYAKANKKQMKNDDPTKLSKFIIFLDMNNLYGSAMSKYLPYSRFKWLKSADNFDVNSISEKSPIGYIL